MSTSDPSAYLADNIKSLMYPVKPTVDAVFRRVTARPIGAEIGRGTIQRVLEGPPNSRLVSLYQISKGFGLEVWQLLVPGLAPSGALPQLRDAAERVSGPAPIATADPISDLGAKMLREEPSEEKRRVALYYLTAMLSMDAWPAPESTSSWHHWNELQSHDAEARPSPAPSHERQQGR